MLLNVAPILYVPATSAMNWVSTKSVFLFRTSARLPYALLSGMDNCSHPMRFPVFRHHVACSASIVWVLGSSSSTIGLEDGLGAGEKFGTSFFVPLIFR